MSTWVSQKKISGRRPYPTDLRLSFSHFSFRNVQGAPQQGIFSLFLVETAAGELNLGEVGFPEENIEYVFPIDLVSLNSQCWISCWNTIVLSDGLPFNWCLSILNDLAISEVEMESVHFRKHELSKGRKCSIQQVDSPEIIQRPKSAIINALVASYAPWYVIVTAPLYHRIKYYMFIRFTWFPSTRDARYSNNPSVCIPFPPFAPGFKSHVKVSTPYPRLSHLIRGGQSNIFLTIWSGLICQIHCGRCFFGSS